MSANRSEPPDLAKIAEEHRELRGTLGRLEETTDLKQLLSLLLALRAQLDLHFAEEEGAGNLHEIIGGAPQHSRKLEELWREHRAILRTIDRLVVQARDLLVTARAAIGSDVAELCQRLREHEERESELLTDSVYTDTGGGG